ncbi:hypothetical protein DIPPA_01635 [Diplonema papillatum]|nr:hypothetical protein DIPPA_01635 [Diplonema papillatum]
MWRLRRVVALDDSEGVKIHSSCHKEVVIRRVVAVKKARVYHTAHVLRFKDVLYLVTVGGHRCSRDATEKTITAPAAAQYLLSDVTIHSLKHNSLVQNLSLPFAMAAHAGVVLSERKLGLFGGWGPDKQLLQSFLVVSFKVDDTGRVTDLHAESASAPGALHPIPRMMHSACIFTLKTRNVIVVFGGLCCRVGRNHFEPTAITEFFDVTTYAHVPYHVTHESPVARSACAAVSLPAGGGVVIHGGIDKDNNVLNDLWILNGKPLEQGTLSFAWREVCLHTGVPRLGHTLTAVSSESLVLVGGHSHQLCHSSPVQSDGLIFDINLGTSTVIPLFNARDAMIAWHAAVVFCYPTSPQKPLSFPFSLVAALDGKPQQPVIIVVVGGIAGNDVSAAHLKSAWPAVKLDFPEDELNGAITHIRLNPQQVGKNGDIDLRSSGRDTRTQDATRPAEGGTRQDTALLRSAFSAGKQPSLTRTALAAGSGGHTPTAGARSPVQNASCLKSPQPLAEAIVASVCCTLAAASRLVATPSPLPPSPGIQKSSIASSSAKSLVSQLVQPVLGGSPPLRSASEGNVKAASTVSLASDVMNTARILDWKHEQGILETPRGIDLEPHKSAESSQAETSSRTMDDPKADKGSSHPFSEAIEKLREFAKYPDRKFEKTAQLLRDHAWKAMETMALINGQGKEVDEDVTKSIGITTPSSSAKPPRTPIIVVREICTPPDITEGQQVIVRELPESPTSATTSNTIHAAVEMLDVGKPDKGRSTHLHFSVDLPHIGSQSVSSVAITSPQTSSETHNVSTSNLEALEASSDRNVDFTSQLVHPSIPSETSEPLAPPEKPVVTVTPLPGTPQPEAGRNADTADSVVSLQVRELSTVTPPRSRMVVQGLSSPSERAAEDLTPRHAGQAGSSMASITSTSSSPSFSASAPSVLFVRCDILSRLRGPESIVLTIPQDVAWSSFLEILTENALPVIEFLDIELLANVKEVGSVGSKLSQAWILKIGRLEWVFDESKMALICSAHFQNFLQHCISGPVGTPSGAKSPGGRIILTLLDSAPLSPNCPGALADSSNAGVAIAIEKDKELEEVATTTATLTTSLTPPSLPDASLHKPIKIGRWSQGRLLGSGSYGTVYQALDNDTGGMFAVKKISVDSDNKKQVDALQSEVDMLKKLNHPNIVNLLGTQRGQDCVYILMEYMAGGSVAAMAKQYGRGVGLDTVVLQRFTRQILQGLAYLHSQNVIHRDIKGDNIFCNHKGVVKLGDFGASKVLSEATSCANSGLKGTVLFFAPEVVSGANYSYASDIWALGCTMIEVATGMHPWASQADTGREDLQIWVSVLQKIVANGGTAPPVPEKMPPSAVDFLHECFRQTPSQRPTASELMESAFLKEVFTERNDRSMPDCNFSESEAPTDAEVTSGYYSTIILDSDIVSPPPSISPSQLSLATSPGTLRSSTAELVVTTTLGILAIASMQKPFLGFSL